MELANILAKVSKTVLKWFRDAPRRRIHCWSVGTNLKVCFFSDPADIRLFVFAGVASMPLSNPWVISGVVATSLPCLVSGNAGSFLRGTVGCMVRS